MFQYVALGLLAFALVILLVNVIKALIRGLKKTVGTLIAIVLSAIIAGVVTVIICKPDSSVMLKLFNWLQGILPEGAIRDLFAIDELSTAVSYYAIMIIAPFFFAVAYVLISFIISIVVAILVKIVPPYKKPGALLNRLGGAGVGLVCGLLVAAILLMPIVGTINVVTSVVDTEALGAGDGEMSGEDDELMQILNEAANDPTVDLFVTVGIGPLYDLFASAKFNGERVYLRNDLSAVMAMLENVQALSGEMSQFDDTQINALKGIVANLETSPLLTGVVAGVFSTASEKWLAGETFIGIEKFSAGELFDPVIDEMLGVMATSTGDTIGADLGTMIEIFDILIQSGILNEGGDYQSMLTKLGNGVVADLIVAINRNERMRPLADEIAALSVRALATSIGIPATADDAYGMLMGNIADLLEAGYGKDEEERATALKTDLVKALDNYGVALEGDAADHVVDSMIADLGDMSQVTASDVSEFFLVYSIATKDRSTKANGGDYSFDLLSDGKGHEVEIREDGTIVVDGRVLKNYNADDYRDSAAYRSGADGVDFGGAASLFSAESMDSVMLTLEDIMGTLGNFADVADIEAEAKKIGEIITEAAQIFNGLDLENTKPEELLAKMGGILDKMKATEIFGADSTASLVKAILQNENVTSSLGITKTQATQFAEKLEEVANKTETGYTDATNAVSATINAVNTSKDSTKTAEEKQQASEEMINVMTPENAELISSLMSGDMMASQGAAEESADQVSEVMDLLLTNMAEYKSSEPDSASVSAEAEAVNHALSLAAMGSEGLNDQPLFNTQDGQAGVLGSTPDEFINTVVNSEVIMETVEQAVYDKEFGQNPLGIPALEAEEEEQVVAALENYFEKNGGGSELERKLEAIAAMVNVNIDLQ